MSGISRVPWSVCVWHMSACQSTHACLTPAGNLRLCRPHTQTLNAVVSDCSAPAPRAQGESWMVSESVSHGGALPYNWMIENTIAPVTNADGSPGLLQVPHLSLHEAGYGSLLDTTWVAV